MYRILIIQTASIGDVILATAMLESLHASQPEVSIDMLVKKGNEGLFPGHPYLHDLMVWDKRDRKYRNLIKILLKVREARYDLVINIQRFFSSGLITVCSGAKETRGFKKNPLSMFFTRRFDHNIRENLHEIDRNFVLVEDLRGVKRRLPRLYPDPAEPAGIRLVPGEYYTISPASLWFTKQYPATKWCDLIRKIDTDKTIFLLGSGQDDGICRDIIQRTGHPGIVNLAGRLTFLQSAALMEKAAMNFTNDSAPMHLASAVNAPVTAIYCSTVPDFGFGPLSDDSSVVQVSTSLPCRPCGLHGFRSCPEKHFRCALDIDTGILVQRLR